MLRTVVVFAALCLIGCPPADTTSSDPSTPSFLDAVRQQPLAPAEAALLHIVESRIYTTGDKLEAAKALAEIEKARIVTQSREMNRRVSELEKR